jgi:hypothetical protein
VCQFRDEVRTPTVANFGDTKEELKLFLEEKEQLLEGDAQGEAMTGSLYKPPSFWP